MKEQIQENPHTAVALLRNLEVIRVMRGTHWTMTNQYIIQNTKHPKVRGGTGIHDVLQCCNYIYLISVRFQFDDGLALKGNLLYIRDGRVNIAILFFPLLVILSLYCVIHP